MKKRTRYLIRVRSSCCSVFLRQELVNHRSQRTAGQRSHQENPVDGKRTVEQCRAKGTGRIDRSPCERDAQQVYQHQRAADHKAGRVVHIPADCVVLSLGVRPENRLADELAKTFPRVYAVGDAVKSGTIADAVKSANAVCDSIR